MTHTPYRQIGTPTRGGIVAVCDHASNHVPEGVELGVTAEVLDKHVGWDIGTAGVVERLVRRHGMAAHLATLSRLVIDLHREEDSKGLVPEVSDGILIPGNIGADREGRIEAYHRPYHAAIASWLDEADPALILSVHSFTPCMEDRGEPRPWEIALLYNEDDRAAQHAMKFFADQGLVVGDNEPYSGRQLNATMNRHAEARGRPYCAIEIRNDLIANEMGQARFAKLLAQMGEGVVHALAQGG